MGGKIKLRGEKGKTFRWFWRVNSGDLDFGIQKNGEMAYPTFRISTEFHPEFGSMECRDDDEYTFFFDNSHGKIWSKEVSYKITLQVKLFLKKKLKLPTYVL
ncbi:Emp24/gp25L/p24 family protein [Cooperia oncophora]